MRKINTNCIKIGPSGNSLSFYESGHKHTYQAAKWLADMGLNAYEYSFGRGISMSDETAAKIGAEFALNAVQISAHAPYYINFASINPELVDKSYGYLAKSIDAVQKMGGERVVFHPASMGKQTRQQAFDAALAGIRQAAERLDSEGYKNFKICAETMGKHGQIGTVPEILQFCTLADFIYPCFDFGHINSYFGGCLKTTDDYRRIIDQTFEKLGEEKTKNMHIHFSKIMYAEKGEIKHLTFADTQYGPEYAPLAQVINEYKLTPTIICESDGTMAEDAVTIKKFHTLI